MGLINLLDVIGSGLVLAGLVWGGTSLMRLKSQLENQKAVIRQIHDESMGARQRGEEYDAADHLRASGVPFTTYDDLLYTSQDAQLAAVDQLRPKLTGPFLVTASGTAISFIRALLLVCGLGS